MSTTTPNIRNILAAVLAVQLHDDDGGRPTVADVLPDALAKQAKDTAEGFIPVHSVVFCRRCRKVFLPGGAAKVDSMMPCGHTPDVWMVGEMIVDNEDDARFIHWAAREGHLEEVIDSLEDEGGHYDPSSCEAGRLVLPEV